MPDARITTYFEPTLLRQAARLAFIMTVALVANFALAKDFDDTAARWANCFPPNPPGRLDPKDYRKVSDKWRRTIDRHHFDSHSAAFLARRLKVPAGQTGQYQPPSAGFDYTLWGLPNHPRALAAIEKLAFENKTDKLPKMLLPARCYFERAIRFYPDDPVPHAEKAVFHVERADTLSKSSSEIDVYLAWSLIEIGKYEDATKYAKRLYSKGYPLQGLRNRLRREGVEIE